MKERRKNEKKKEWEEERMRRRKNEKKKEWEEGGRILQIFLPLLNRTPITEKDLISIDMKLDRRIEEKIFSANQSLLRFDIFDMFLVWMRDAWIVFKFGKFNH